MLSEQADLSSVGVSAYGPPRHFAVSPIFSLLEALRTLVGAGAGRLGSE